MKKPLSHQKKKKNQPKNFMKYSSMATQMIIIIGGTTWGGFKLDAHWHTLPVFTVILSLSGVGLAIYFSIKDFIKQD